MKDGAQCLAAAYLHLQPISAVGGGVTLFALLELYRKGEVTWDQSEPFGPITVKKASA